MRSTTGEVFMRLMLDAVDVTHIPADWPGLVAGYLDGAVIRSTLPALRLRFPGKTPVTIAVTAHQDAHVLDVESGDARPDQVPDWVRRQRALGKDPTVYTSTAVWPQVKAACVVAGIVPPWWWQADWDGDPTLDTDPRAVAKQFTNGVTPADAPHRIPGCDTSVVADYWPGVDPVPLKRLEADVFELIHNTATGDIFAWSAGGAWWHVPNPDWGKVALASPLCTGQRDVGQQEFDLLKAVSASARSPQ